MLGSLIPSSRYLVRRALRQVDWERADLIVEYGPGLGTFTEEILKRMRPDGRLLVFETQSDFVRHLEEIQDPRLEVIHGSAEEVAAALEERGAGRADYVLSGIPFSLMPEALRDSILEHTRSILDPEGAMLVYQFSPTIRRPLERVFRQVESEFEPRNVLPATVYLCHP